MSVRILERVIETRLQTVGVGTNEDPIRALVQYWDEDGVLLATVDPCKPYPSHVQSDAEGAKR